MQIGLTIPLMRYLGIQSLPKGGPCPGGFCWDLHRITLCGRDCLLAVHCETRYTFTLYDISAADRADLPGAFSRGLAASLAAAGFEASVIRRYLNEAGQITLTKTHGRREVAFLNRAWEDVLAMDYAVDRSKQEQPLLDHAVNSLLRRCAGFAGYATARERMDTSLGR